MFTSKWQTCVGEECLRWPVSGNHYFLYGWIKSPTFSPCVMWKHAIVRPYCLWAGCICDNIMRSLDPVTQWVVYFPCQCQWCTSQIVWRPFEKYMQYQQLKMLLQIRISRSVAITVHWNEYSPDRLTRSFLSLSPHRDPFESQDQVSFPAMNFSFITPQISTIEFYRLIPNNKPLIINHDSSTTKHS